jgi:hypothetical protein
MRNLIQSVFELAAYAVAGARHVAGIEEPREASSRKGSREGYGAWNLLEGPSRLSGSRGRAMSISLRPARQVHGR